MQEPVEHQPDENPADPGWLEHLEFRLHEVVDAGEDRDRIDEAVQIAPAQAPELPDHVVVGGDA